MRAREREKLTNCLLRESSNARADDPQAPACARRHAGMALVSPSVACKGVEACASCSVFCYILRGTRSLCTKVASPLQSCIRARFSWQCLYKHEHDNVQQSHTIASTLLISHLLRRLSLR
jgi:hypothetical protein